MKKFKDYIKDIKKLAPILIPVEPVHGAHAKKKHKKLDEEEEKGHRDWYEFSNHNPNPHLGNAVEDVGAALDKSRDDFIKHHQNLPAVKDYTSSSAMINRHLLKKAKGEKGSLEHYPLDSPDMKETKSDKLNHIRSLDNSLSQPNARLKHDVHVFHGAGFNPDELASQHPERHIRSAAFMSTSISPRTAIEFGGKHVLHIHLKKDKDHAIYLGQNSTLAHEREMLLPRDTTLHIHHEPEELSNGTKVWKAHVVHQDHEHEGYKP